MAIGARKFIPVALIGVVLAGVIGLLVMNLDLSFGGRPSAAPAVTPEALPRSATNSDADAIIVAQLNIEACASRPAEEQERCVQLREIEQSAGFGPMPNDPGYEGCRLGELPASYCGDVRPNTTPIIRTSETPARDYPLVTE